VIRRKTRVLAGVRKGVAAVHKAVEIVNGKSAATQSVVTSKPATLVKARQLADAPDVAPRKGRSKITNGKKFIGGIDQRNPWVRRAKDVLSMHISDLGGVEQCSSAELSIARRCAVITTELEQLEQRFALARGKAETADLDLYQKLSNTLRRLLQSLGLHRRSKDVTPDPLQFARSYQNGDGA
jgi:hypothetical protein